MTGLAQGELWEVLPIKLCLNIAAPAVFVWFVVSVFPTSLLITEMIHGLEANKSNSSFSYQGKKCSEGVLYKTPFATLCVFAIEISA